MPVSKTTIEERIARVLAGRQLSANAEGEEEQAGPSVDMEWKDHLDSARAILRTMREPDERMAQAGDVAVWEAMIEAAIKEGQPSMFGA